MIVWLSVAAGGAIGALSRFGLSVWLAPEAGKFPIATFTANIIGCFLMGALYVLIMDKQIIPIAWRPFLMVGCLGALTTFSTFSLEALNLWLAQHVVLAITYVMATVFTTLLAVWAGFSLTALAFK